MDLATKAQETLDDALNASGRSRGHIAAGVALCVGAIALTAVVAALQPQPATPGEKPSRRPAIRAIWPAIFSLTNLAALRVWNAPDGPRRTRALALWGGLQALNLFWMIMRPTDQRLRVAAAVSTAALTTVYAHAAAYVDEKAAGMVAPTGFAGLSALVATKPAGA